eukprot:COSAG05_NODE_8720_length_677_cov_1.610727_1_plen_176_part_01
MCRGWRKSGQGEKASGRQEERARVTAVGEVSRRAARQAPPTDATAAPSYSVIVDTADGAPGRPGRGPIVDVSAKRRQLDKTTYATKYSLFVDPTDGAPVHPGLGPIVDISAKRRQLDATTYAAKASMVRDAPATPIADSTRPKHDRAPPTDATAAPSYSVIVDTADGAPGRPGRGP